MTRIDLGVFVVGWAIGWALLWRGRPLPASETTPSAPAPRAPIAVIVPARDEAVALATLLPVIARQLRAGDELVVVDDQSTDDTASVATHHGATVVVPPALPEGWLGKPNACAAGVGATTAPVLLFVDADVEPAADLLDRLAPVLARQRHAIVSVQPWHRTQRLAEQASILCNVAALMGSGAFTIAGDRVRATVAFGPVLAIDRDVYLRAGGHEAVRSMHTEDIGLARAVGHVRLFTGRPDTSFRMYPDGFRQTLDGWTRSIATGARSTRWWLAMATACWMAAIAGGWLAGGWPWSAPLASATIYAASALQVWVLGRRAGSIRLVTALLFPLAVAVFVVIVARSAFALLFRRDVEWKGRRVAARPS
ncbi:MAG: glycosyltransferase family 2 protein [Ilumatobacteraceae bacterium]